MQATDLMEVVQPVKYAIFSTESHRMEMMSSDPHTFASCYSNTTRSLTQPVMLATTIVSKVHVHKTLFNAKSGTRAFIKGVDELPN